MNEESAPSSISRVKTINSETGDISSDSVVVEEPLEIRLRKGGTETQLGITMRTPGSDLELAAGFIWGEGFLGNPDDLMSVKVCGDKSLTRRQRANVVIVEISQNAPTPPRSLERRFTITSACGVCGSSNIDDLRSRGVKKVIPTTHSIKNLAKMASLLEGRQLNFAKTGGLHAAALIDIEGSAVWVKEDVGRHNAVDKVVGAALMAKKLPLSNWTLVISGRVGYEIVQKAVVAGISAVVGVSAPTSLAIELAEEFGLTLLAFTRNGIGKQYLTSGELL